MPTNGAQTAETYLGVEGVQRGNRLANPTTLTDGVHAFTYPASVPNDQFALAGTWAATDESLTAQQGAGNKEVTVTASRWSERA
jgi:hypothetical protein